MIALPFPQREAVPLVLSSRWRCPLTVAGFDFGALPAVDLVNVSSGYLYRILDYSFSLDIPEDAFQSSQDPARPFAFRVLTEPAKLDVLAKPVPVPLYHRGAPMLQYVMIPDTSTAARARLAGRLVPGSVALLGYSEITATLTLNVQAVHNEKWIERFERGEI
jgi:hypothetical protein